MPGISGDRPSLDRLKQIQKLSSLSQQLEEGRQLCTQGPRAEMVLKWLLSAIPKSAESRSSSQTWILLTSCVRIIPVRRVAGLLAVNAFVDVLSCTCAEHSLPAETVVELVNCLNVLFMISNRQEGAAIKSLLSVDDEQAAVLCGRLFRHVYNAFGQDEDGVCNIRDRDLLAPGIRIWTLRKRSESGDSSFANGCLLSLSLLLATMRRYPARASPKRKRESASSVSVEAQIRVLESMIAQHFVMPMRAAYTKKADIWQQGPEQYQPRMARLRSFFEPLAFEAALVDNGRDQEILPLILDITIRSTDGSSPKHRLRERPWIEAVFEALHGCHLQTSASGNCEALIEMLEEVYRLKFSLSATSLSSMVREHASMSSTQDICSSWKLIGKICALDASPFIDADLTDLMLTTIGGTGVGSRSTDTVTNFQFLQENVLDHILRILAQSRRFDVFLTAWLKHLRSDFHDRQDSIWTGIVARCTATIARELAPDYIVSNFDNYSIRVQEAIASGSLAPADEAQVFADLVLLRAFLDALRDEELQERTFLKSWALFQSLTSVGNVDRFENHRSLFAELVLATDSAIRKDFPIWLVKEGSDTEVEAQAEKLLSSSLIKSAALATGRQPQSLPQQDQLSSACGALAATLFNAFAPSRQLASCATICERTSETIRRYQLLGMQALLKYPVSLRSFQETASYAIDLQTLQDTAAADPRQAGDSLALLKAVLLVLSDQRDHAAFEASVQLLDIGHGGRKRSKRDTPENEAVALSLLNTLTTSAFDKSQREQLINSLTKLPPPGSIALMQQRLAVLLSLIQPLNVDVDLVTDAACIWKIAHAVSSLRAGLQSHLAESVDQAALFDALAELAKVLFSHLSKPQAPEKVKVVLAQQETLIVEQMAKLSDASMSMQQIGGLVIINTALTAVDEYGHGASELALSTNRKTVLRYLEWLRGRVAEYDGASDDLLVDALAWRALVSFPSKFLQGLPRKGAAHLEEVVGHAVAWLAVHCNASQEKSNDASTSDLAPYCYQIVAEYATGEPAPFAALSIQILQVGLSARAQVSVLQSFEKAFGRKDVSWKHSLILELMRVNSGQLRSSLQLWRAAIRMVEKHEFEHWSSDGSAPSILRNTIEMVGDDNHDPVARSLALQTLVVLIKDKSFVLDQSGIELVLSFLQHLLKRSNSTVIFFPEMCQVMTTILTHHRSRLQGRFHLVTVVLVGLLTSVFQQADNPGKQKAFALRQARSWARLLALFCDPPLVRHRHKSSDLVDETRKEKAHVGQYVPYVLHHFCTQILSNQSGDGLREALTPGVWAIFEAMETNSTDAVKVLSAAMNNAERAVLRSAYDDWRRFAKWEGL